MKGLILLGTLVLTFGFSTIPFAQTYIFGVKTPIEQRAVKNEIKGGKVEMDFISFYLSPKGTNTSSSYSYDHLPEDKDSYVVFGVRIPVNPSL